MSDRWLLTEVQTGFLSDAVRQVQQAQQVVQLRTSMILKELAEVHGVDPTTCQGKLVDSGEGKLAFEIQAPDKPDTQRKPGKQSPAI